MSMVLERCRCARRPSGCKIMWAADGEDGRRGSRSRPWRRLRSVRSTGRPAGVLPGLDPPHRLRLELPAEAAALSLGHRFSFSENCPYFPCLIPGGHSIASAHQIIVRCHRISGVGASAATPLLRETKSFRDRPTSEERSTTGRHRFRVPHCARLRTVVPHSTTNQGRFVMQLAPMTEANAGILELSSFHLLRRSLSRFFSRWSGEMASVLPERVTGA